MSDMIYYKNGEETFRISPPTVETKCPETKLEVKKMTEIEKTEGEIKVLQAKLKKDSTFCRINLYQLSFPPHWIQLLLSSQSDK